MQDFILERFFAKHEFPSKYLLCCSDCESMSIEDLLNLTDSPQETQRQFNQVWLSYTHAVGHPDLRKEISKLYEKVKPEDILVFAGAEEGIFVYMNSILTKDDHVIVHYPAYQSL